MTDPRLARLARLAGLIRDARLARLADATKRIEALDRQIAALPTVPEAAEDPALALAALRHVQWAAEQRARLSAERPPLAARRDATMDEARTALARAEVLARLAARRGDQPS